MKKVLFMVALSTLLLASCSQSSKKQDVAETDTTAIVVGDTVASVSPETETVINEIDSTSNEVDKLVNQL